MIMRKYDTDDDGEIDFTEFKGMVDQIQKGNTEEYDSDEEKANWDAKEQARQNKKNNVNPTN